MRPLALITGATRGLGLALAHELNTSHDLLIGGTDPRRVQAICNTLTSASPFVADLTDDHAVRTATARVNRLDVLINNAATAPVGPLEQTTRNDFKAVLDLNVVAIADLTTKLLPLLRTSRGLIMMVNSGAGLRGEARAPLYAASKFALTGLTDSLRQAERGLVRVVSAHPGPMATDMQEGMARALGVDYRAEDHMRAEDVARLLADVVRAPRGLTVERVEIRPS